VRSSFLTVLAAFALVGCPRDAPVAGRARPAVTAEVAAAYRTVWTLNESVAARQGNDCNERILAVLDEPTLPGTPELDLLRARLLSDVKAEPVLFTQRPGYAESGDAAVLSYRRWLERTRHPMSVLGQLMPFVIAKPEVGRDVLLRDGYLYAESAVLAGALVSVVRAEHLFREPEIWIQRGERLLRARRDGKVYRYVDGAQQDEVVTLLLFDRVGSGPVPEAVHRDLRALRDRLHFNRLQVLHQTEGSMVVELFYGDRGVVTLLESHGAHVSLACEMPAPELASEIRVLRERGDRRLKAVRALQSAIALQIDDRLPFDEPRHERGQEDGKMRPLWIWAYLEGRADYDIRLDTYPVFDARGRPHVPEVCVDFLLDTLERAGGTWWRARGEPRERVAGRFDFDQFARTELRRAPAFVAFARAHPEWFEVLEVGAADQHEMGDEAFFEYLEQHGSDFSPGDMVLIAGRAPWDPSNTIHYHSFFVYESDPVSGMPTLVAGNPGHPRLVAWQWEARRTPKRSLRFRIRPDTDWLVAIVNPVTGEQLLPPPLSVGSP
jgi:hypothetical protein